eukprot:2591526-Pyramimonas_sp.AAC.1
MTTTLAWATSNLRTLADFAVLRVLFRAVGGPISGAVNSAILSLADFGPSGLTQRSNLSPVDVRS